MAQRDRHRRQRQPRMEHWWEAHTPEVGHVSVMDGRLSLDRVPIPDGRAWPDVIICVMKHRS